MGLVLDRLGSWLGRTLSRPVHVHGSARPTPPDVLLACLRPGDVLLAEGHSRISSAIKYLTQSTWSHAALFVGDARAGRAPEGHCFIEADIRSATARAATSAGRPGLQGTMILMGRVG